MKTWKVVDKKERLERNRSKRIYVDNVLTPTVLAVAVTWECPNCALTCVTSSSIPPMFCGWCNYALSGAQVRTPQEAREYRDRIMDAEAAVWAAKREAKQREKDRYYYQRARLEEMEAAEQAGR